MKGDVDAYRQAPVLFRGDTFKTTWHLISTNYTSTENLMMDL